MDRKNITIPVAIVIAGALIGLSIVYTFGGKGAAAPSPEKLMLEKASGIPAVTDADHVLGNKDAELFLIEYSDLECPFCGRFYPVIEQVVRDYEGKVAWVHRNFPLTSIHDLALPAAQAAECVAKLKGEEAYATFISTIYQNQPSLSESYIVSQALLFGIEKAELEACVASPEIEARIAGEFQAAVSAGAQGTPFTVIMNRKGKVVGVLPGAVPFEEAKAQIDALLR